MAKQQFQTLRGMCDVLPEAAAQYDYLTDQFRQLAESAGYGRIETPLLEDAALFVRGVGADTDAVSKELYLFKDRSDNEVALRPEFTAGIARAYIERGISSMPQPVKLYTIGPAFRYDRPQAGRQRQFNQVNAEVFGDGAPSVDAQVIMLAQRFLRRVRLGKVTLQLNSIGDSACRPKYRKVLIEYLEDNAKKLAAIDRDRVKNNPLRVLDSKEPSTVTILADAPQTLNYLCEACQTHFAGVLEYLDDLGVAYDLNPLLVRGLDYYTRTVFEFYGEREGAQSSVGGGGRYDMLVEQLGGQSTPGVGFAMGLERLLIELGAAGALPQPVATRRVYVASLGEPARLAAFRLIEQLLDGGVAAVGAVDRDGIGTQLARADKLGVSNAIIIGQKEVREGTVILRDMTSGAQEILPTDGIIAELRSRFGVA
ncbi:MAG TPA: histidine--tRNA ligase [Candidatus Saccharimonadia bacterium]|nr:histidine--tRNA ligase [Candidatus Saccharimonadia bacterium]